MAITDYSSLQSAVGDWLNRSDLTAVLPSFIQLTETNLNRTLRLREMLTDATIAGWNTSEFVPLPTDFLELYDLEETYPPSTSANPPLRYVSSDELKQIKSALPNGVTRWYTITGNYIELWPSPVSNSDNGTGFNMTLTYYAKIPTLSIADPTNFLLTKSPDVYLFGALLQASPYLKDDTRVQIWDGAYQRSIAALQSENERAMRPSTTLIARKRVF